MLIYLNLIETEEDKRKFERIYLAYRQTMFYAANRILKNQDSAEDAVHNAFLRVINHLEKINENDCHKTRAFLVVIVENIAIDIYRKEKKHNTISFDEVDIYIADEQKTSTENIDELTEIFKELPINYSTVLRLKYAQGYSDMEISEILQISEDNVRQRIARAKKKIKTLIKKEDVVQ